MSNSENPTHPKSYWIGPYGIRVPLDVDSIRDSDGCNHLYQNGCVTEMYNPNPPTKEEYFERYVTLRNDGHYWWKCKRANLLTIGENTYNLDDYDYIHCYDFIAMGGWRKKIGLIKDSTTCDPLDSGNYDWVLVFDEVANHIYGGEEKETEELLHNRVLFTQVENYLEQYPQKHIVTIPDGACGCFTKRKTDLE